MEVASAPQYQNDPNVTSNAMDTTMDIDMDLDLGPLPEPEAIETEQDPMQASAVAEEGTVDHLEEDATYEKVHVRGVDELATSDIKQFATEHFNVEEPSRIEWIDDTSANIVYSSAEVGLQALAALTQVGVEDASALPYLRLRSAKTLSSHPDSVLQVRSAVKTDKKKPRAHEASRFYLMHPEHDPRERLRREFSERRRHGGRDDSEGDYTRRRFDDREHRRRRDRGEEEGFSAGMYDDEPSDADRGRNRSRRGKRAELFPDRDDESGRLRGRSASPGRDLLDEDSRDDGDRRRRFRERSPHVPRRNEGRELFPSNGSDSNSRELFPNKTASTYLKKELFPTKTASNHRRSDAFDAADETAESLAKRITVPLVDGAHDQDTSRRNANVELFPQSGGNGVSIRGAAAQDSGLSIRGAANGLSIKGRGASVRELFPSKYGNNAGKELFSDKLEGRGGRRRKAEDMFS
ncbi:hypothetical protein ANI_1_622014 [Paecilomyces variotii No. 5]|uniref:Uncharacterized protein n=1 Tax=Byssochlamys spectabilis (strain No. 5 / NBRC 109023) TaxID=1356009 RepID=V5HSW5_BYSSN|nr:hypothetical protein ANI_1_622014 [Paecilomyces variotii No. 5]